jgi:hypothetical protein
VTSLISFTNRNLNLLDWIAFLIAASGIRLLALAINARTTTRLINPTQRHRFFLLAKLSHLIGVDNRLFTDTLRIVAATIMDVFNDTVAILLAAPIYGGVIPVEQKHLRRRLRPVKQNSPSQQKNRQPPHRPLVYGYFISQ